MQKTVLTLLFLLTLNPCHAETKSESQEDVLTIAVPSKLENADPTKAWNIFESFLIGAYCTPLTRITHNGEIVGHVLKSWQISSDRRQYVLNLREGIKFHDLSTLKAIDVVYSLSRHFWKTNESVSVDFLRYPFPHIENIEVGSYIESLAIENDYKIVVNLKKPYLPFLQLLSTTTLCIVKKDHPLVGAGPMRISKTKDGIGWELTYFSEYFEKLSPVQRKIKLVSILDSEQAIAHLRDNKIDFVAGSYSRFSEDDKHFKNKLDYATLNQLVLNPRRRLLKSLKARKILGLLLQKIGWESRNLKYYQKPTQHMIPIEAFSLTNLKDSKSKSDLIEDLANLSSTFDRPIKIVLLEGMFNENFLDELKYILKKTKTANTIHIVKGPDYGKELKSGNFDIINLPTTLVFYDPDGFHVTSEKFYKSFSNESIQEIGQNRYLADKSTRNQEYRKHLEQYRSQWIVVPLHSLNIPLISSQKIELPKTKFRFLFELWNIKKIQ